MQRNLDIARVPNILENTHGKKREISVEAQHIILSNTATTKLLKPFVCVCAQEVVGFTFLHCAEETEQNSS